MGLTQQQIKNIKTKEKQTYAGMFQKFAEIDAKVSLKCVSDMYICYHFFVKMISSLLVRMSKLQSFKNIINEVEGTIHLPAIV